MRSKVRTLVVSGVVVAALAATAVVLLRPGDPEVAPQSASQGGSQSDPRSFVFRHFPQGSVGAEIGVWKGDFSTEMLENIHPSKLHLIDPWAHESGDKYRLAWYGGDDEEEGQRKMDAIYDGVVSRFSDAIDSGVVVLHRQPSAEASKAFPDEYFDWVYIDGNHLYEFVKQDLELYYPKVKKGGYITGDDYAEGGWWKGGVKRALDEFLEKDLVEVVEIRYGQFVLKKK